MGRNFEAYKIKNKLVLLLNCLNVTISTTTELNTLSISERATGPSYDNFHTMEPMTAGSINSDFFERLFPAT